eukprot:jgi/Galph1/4472/GphlegSOOS_G3194.1
MDGFQELVTPVSNFMVESYRLVRRCTKPDAREFMKIAGATAVGFLVMGFVGFFVRLIHIPVNNILLS